MSDTILETVALAWADLEQVRSEARTNMDLVPYDITARRTRILARLRAAAEDARNEAYILRSEVEDTLEEASRPAIALPDPPAEGGE
jgi:hypothetical protein